MRSGASKAPPPTEHVSLYVRRVVQDKRTNGFDWDMVAVTRENRIFGQRMGDLRLMLEHDQICAFYRNGLLFVFNFHHSQSLKGVPVCVPEPGEYRVVLSSDDQKYGGFENVEKKPYLTKTKNGHYFLELNITSRTCFVLKWEKKPLLHKSTPKRPSPCR